MLVICLLSLLGRAAFAGEFFEADGIALRGYDPVAYFVAARPQKGQPSHSYEYLGSKFYFANEANKRAFMQNPDKYAPQFGGYCAYGAANGYKVSTQPDAFAIVKDRLYLNYNREVLAIWQNDVPGNIALAEKNWPEVSKSALKQ
jgi:YHS domain-containing protein